MGGLFADALGGRSLFADAGWSGCRCGAIRRSKGRAAIRAAPQAAELPPQRKGGRCRHTGARGSHAPREGGRRWRRDGRIWTRRQEECNRLEKSAIGGIRARPREECNKAHDKKKAVRSAPRRSRDAVACCAAIRDAGVAGAADADGEWGIACCHSSDGLLLV